MRLRPTDLELFHSQQHIILNYKWLRDHCSCGECLHESSQQRLRGVTGFPSDVRPLEAHFRPDKNELHIKWSTSKIAKVHKSTYSFPWLSRHSILQQNSQAKFNRIFEPQTWDVRSLKATNLAISYHDFMNSEKTVLQALKIIAQVGICFMKDVPNKLGQVASIAERIGPIQETFYGRIWDVESVYNPKNIAYTELGLGLHMDLMCVHL